MRTLVLPLVLVSLGACGDESSPVRADARPIVDGASSDAAMIDAHVDGPYRHTINVDGIDDFTAGELFATTSASFAAHVTWDDDNLYIGYTGPDLATSTTDAAQKWLFVYLDTVAGGETQSQLYNTQRATFPTGFEADYYVRYKVDGTLTSLEQVSGGTWSSTAITPATGQAGSSSAMLELGIPRSSIGAGAQNATLKLVTYMINEKDQAEGTFAGIYADNFVDGYSTNTTLTRALSVDFAGFSVPNL